VSVLHALGTPAVAEAARRAHDDAVAAGLAYLERHACAVRVSERVVAGRGLVAAAFRHRTSRAADPHLHTHTVVANAAAGPDGRWRALYTPLLYAERKGASATYHVVLRGRLTAELGLGWGVPNGGRSDALDVPERIRAAFSRRRAAVLVEASGELAERPWAERVTRPDRTGLVDFDRLTAEWQRRAGVLSWSAPEPASGHAPHPIALADDGLPGADRWTRADLIVALADRWVEGATAGELETAAGALLASPQVVTLSRGFAAADRFTTRVALARSDATMAALRGKQIDDDPETIDRLRRDASTDGRRLLVVVGDDATADRISARVGAPAVSSGRAVAAVERLDPGDVVVIRKPDSLPSAEVQALLATAARRSVHVLGGSPSRHIARVAEPDAAPATVAVVGGDVTTSGCAVTAADTAIGDWLARRRTGGDAVLVAEGEEVRSLNQRARAALRAVGMLGHDEVGGFAVGDALRFTHGRPAHGIARQARAEVRATDADHGTLEVRLDDGRPMNLTVSDLRGIVHAHVVPPLPSLVAGRGDVFVIGGRVIAQRHLGANQLHRYVTVDDTVIGRRLPTFHLAAARSLDRGVGLSR
jgi:hypothetical protein